MAQVELSEQKWSAIRQVSGLPESARERIEHVLEHYRAFQQVSSTQPRASQTRKQLLGIAKLSEKLITAIIGATPDTSYIVPR
jgi:inorganic pyrophosphatase